MKKTKKILTLLCVTTLLIGALAGCGEKKDNKDSTSKEQTYIAATEATFPPFDTTDKDGKIVGFDMDLMDAIGKDQGFKVEYKPFEFDSLIPTVQSGNADMITAGMNADDPARQKKIDFSKPYWESGLVVVVKKDNKDIKGIKDLKKDMKVASQIGTTSADKVLELEKDGKIKKAVINNGFDQCLLQLQNGDVEALIMDKPVAENALTKYKDLKIVGETLNAEHFGFAVKKGNKDLLEKINKGLEDIKKDGTYDKLKDKWFNKKSEK